MPHGARSVRRTGLQFSTMAWTASMRSTAPERATRETGSPSTTARQCSPSQRYSSTATCGNARGVDIDHIAAVDRQAVVESINEILSSDRPRGYANYYRYGIFHHEDGGSTIVVLDCFLQLQFAYNALRITVIVAISCAVIVFLLLMLLSKRAVRPFVENLERQKRFVTDASHELKTPLAILAADVELLRQPNTEQKWSDSAQAQITRMDKLIKNLVELARTEETIEDSAVTSFSLSEVAQASVEGFQPLAESEGKRLEAHIPPAVELRGVQENMFRLFSILLDNAVKYCDPGGTIRLSLGQRGRNIYLSVSNPCAGADTAQLPRWFDRFYRADSSRARATGGYGIGLSTARAIVSRHRGRITNRCENGQVTFSVVIPQFPKVRKSAVHR
ncbi:MAG: GHKL domain-containing protein [Clostridiales bacterium]|nr:GHKL domain-containing protein [Clostridiales bacterium]